MARELTNDSFDVAGRDPERSVRMGAADPTAVPADGVLELPAPWRLYYGDTLERPRVAFRLVGPRDAPVVAVLGGISAHRRLTGPDGWWQDIVGPGGGVDTTRFRVLGMDYLGGLGASSTPDGESPDLSPGATPPTGAAPRGTPPSGAPPSGTPPSGAPPSGAPPSGAPPFPPVSAIDQADALGKVVEHLNLSRLHAIVGASYGGMVALSFAARHPALVERIVVVSAAARSQVLSTAWRSVQRRIVRDAIARGDGPAGLKLARALAMATYRSAGEFSMRFGGAPVRDGERFRFPVEGYLFARGDDYVQKYRAESFLALSESIDLHDIDASTVRTPATLIAVREDQLVPFNDVEALAAHLGGPARLVEINSIFGHDAFLKESAVLNPILQRALAESLP